MSIAETLLPEFGSFCRKYDVKQRGVLWGYVRNILQRTLPPLLLR